MKQPQDNDSQIILVTGASTGIGLEIARKLYNSPYRTIVTARSSSINRFDKENLYEADHFHIRPLDVTNQKEQETLIDEIQNQWGTVDILINNAGISYRSVIEHLNHDDELNQFNVNYFAPLQLIRLVLPGMRAKQSGRIINISSVGGMMAMPTMGAYSASKFALEGASEALWYETQPWGIKVSLIEPGFINSNAFKKVFFTERSKIANKDASNPYNPYYVNMSGFISKMMESAPATSEDIAKKIINIMHAKNPPLRVPVTRDAWFFYYVRRLLPRRIYHQILYLFLPKIKTWVTR